MAAIVEKVHGKGMAELMQVEFHLGFMSEHLNQVPQALGFEGCILVAGNPKKWGGKKDGRAGALVKIVSKGLTNFGIERNSAGHLRFRRFRLHDKPSMSQIDVADFQRK